MGNPASGCRFSSEMRGHMIMVPRKMVEKNTKNLKKKEN